MPPGAPAAARAPALSVVVPCYDEEAVILETHARLAEACRACVGEDHEIVYVDDGSRDATWSLLQRLAAQDPCVVAVGLSRNFGHQLALSAGLSLARGRRILMIDADLQDPPALLPEMMRRMDAGADVVYGQRVERQGETRFKRASASLFYRVLNRLTDVDIPPDTGDFRLVSRRVLDALLAMPEQHRFVRGLFAWLGFRQEALPYERHARFAGQTKYPLRRMLRLAIDAITGFSIMPLRISIGLALLSFLVALGVLGYALVSWMFFDVVRGWASQVVAISLFAGVQLACLGIMGEYLGRMYLELKRRPLFVVREIVAHRAPSAADDP